MDVGFILDSSGSLRREYSKEKDFLKALAATFGVSSDDSRAGVVTFSYDAEHSIKLKDHSDILSFNNAVDKIFLMGSTTRIDKALRLAQKELFSLSNGGRPGIPKLLVLLTDGSQTPGADVEEPAQIANEIRKSGIRLLVIGIGKGVSMTELLKIGASRENVYSADSFNTLISGEFIDDIVKTGCSAGKEINLVSYFFDVERYFCLQMCFEIRFVKKIIPKV